MFCTQFWRFVRPGLRDKILAGMVAAPFGVVLLALAMWPIERLWMALLGGDMAGAYPRVIAKALTVGITAVLFLGTKIARRSVAQVAGSESGTLLLVVLCLFLVASPAITSGVMLAVIQALLVVMAITRLVRRLASDNEEQRR